MAANVPRTAGIDPMSLLLAAGSGVAGSVAGTISDIANRKRQQQAQREALQASRDANTLDVAQAESGLDPFRHQMSQASALSSLDRLERGSYKPVSLSAAPGYEKYVPHLFGGASYEKSPELIADARALKQNVRGGNVAPTMTDPTNYGKSSALDLVSIAAAGKDPATVNGSVGAPRNVESYTAGVQTRDAGGMGTAETRGTDVSVQQAQQILDRAIRSELGRTPNPGEIEAMLTGQGLKPGDRWVGSQGLNFVLNTLRSQGQGQELFAPSFTGRG
jgi:hypothetical protein